MNLEELTKPMRFFVKTATSRILYSMPNNILVVKPRRTRWAGHITRIGREEVYTGFGGET